MASPTCRNHDAAATTTTTTIPTKDYEVGVVIGEGSFGRVVHARHKASGKDVAIKVFDKMDFAKRPQLMQSIWMERYVLQEFRSSSFVVNLWGAFTDEHCVYLVMECLKGGDLSLLIREGLEKGRCKDKTWWRTNVVPHYALQIIEAVEFLHQHSTIHCDLKPANLLLDQQGKVVLADFGSAIRINKNKPQSNMNNNTQNNGDYNDDDAAADTASKNINKQQNHDDDKSTTFHNHHDHSNGSCCRGSSTIPIGTIDYASPELLKGKELGIATDLWSLGCIFVALHWGKSPFHEASDALAVDGIIRYANADEKQIDNLPPLLNKQSFRELPGGWESLILGLLNPNPNMRLGVGAVNGNVCGDDDNSNTGSISSNTNTNTATSICKLVPGYRKIDYLNSAPPFLSPQPDWIIESKKSKTIDGSHGWSSFLL